MFATKKPSEKTLELVGQLRGLREDEAKLIDKWERENKAAQEAERLLKTITTPNNIELMLSLTMTKHAPERTKIALDALRVKIKSLEEQIAKEASEPPASSDIKKSETEIKGSSSSSSQSPLQSQFTPAVVSPYGPFPPESSSSSSSSSSTSSESLVPMSEYIFPFKISTDLRNTCISFEQLEILSKTKTMTLCFLRESSDPNRQYVTLEYFFEKDEKGEARLRRCGIGLFGPQTSTWKAIYGNDPSKDFKGCVPLPSELPPQTMKALFDETKSYLEFKGYKEIIFYQPTLIEEPGSTNDRVLPSEPPYGTPVNIETIIFHTTPKPKLWVSGHSAYASDSAFPSEPLSSSPVSSSSSVYSGSIVSSPVSSSSSGSIASSPLSSSTPSRSSSTSSSSSSSHPSSSSSSSSNPSSSSSSSSSFYRAAAPTQSPSPFFAFFPPASTGASPPTSTSPSSQSSPAVHASSTLPSPPPTLNPLMVGLTQALFQDPQFMQEMQNSFFRGLQYGIQQQQQLLHPTFPLPSPSPSTSPTPRVVSETTLTTIRSNLLMQFPEQISEVTVTVSPQAQTLAVVFKNDACYRNCVVNSDFLAYFNLTQSQIMGGQFGNRTLIVNLAQIKNLQTIALKIR